MFYYFKEDLSHKDIKKLLKGYFAFYMLVSEITLIAPLNAAFKIKFVNIKFTFNASKNLQQPRIYKWNIIESSEINLNN